MYASKFDLLPHIQFNSHVINVRRADHYNNTGCWVISVKSPQSEEEVEQIFDGVMLCTGHHATTYTPKLEGLQHFCGRVIHSQEYKDFEGWQGLEVVVVGIGNSGGDIAAELSRITKQLYLVCRTGTWVYNRIWDFGVPVDLVLLRRFLNVLTRLMPLLTSKYLEAKLNHRFDHELYGLKPACCPRQQHPFINDDLPNRIASGQVIIKPGIKTMTTSTAFFDDGTSADVDAIILCTGYSFGFPYLEQGIIPVIENEVSLFKFMYPLDLPHASLAVIGLIQPQGAVVPIAEMQCRLFCQVLKGNVTLPSNFCMKNDVQLKKDEISKRYAPSRRHTIQVDFIPFMDEIAELIHVKPRILDYVLSDPRLAFALFIGPCLPYQYRLSGPHTWPCARETILTVWKRVLTPTSSLKQNDKNKSKLTKYLNPFKKFVTFLFLFIAIVTYFQYSDTSYLIVLLLFLFMYRRMLFLIAFYLFTTFFLNNWR